MALDAEIVWEVRVAGNSTNGAGFKTGASGTDYSQQDSAQESYTTLATSGAGVTTVTCSGADTFDANIIGNVIQIASGTNVTAGWYEVTARASSTSITVDRAPDNGAGGISSGIGKMGGALDLPTDAFFEQMTVGNKTFIKAGTYSTASIDVSKGGTSTVVFIIEGYNATRGDAPTEDNRPLFAVGANTLSFGNYWHFYNIRVTTTAAAGFKGLTNSLWNNCSSINSSGTVNRRGYTATSTQAIFINCEASGAQSMAFEAGLTYTQIGCYAHDCRIGLNVVSDRGLTLNCIFDTISLTGIEFGGRTDFRVINSTFYNCAEGVGMTDPQRIVFINNIFDSCTTGIQLDTGAGSSDEIFDKNNFNNNTTDVSAGVERGQGTLSLDPQFADAPNGNFAIGNSGLKAAAHPGVFPGELSTSFLDVGAVQSSGGAEVTTAVGLVGG